METVGLHYCGEDIVPDDSFLRRLPAILHPEQRLRLDALVHSADVLTASWQRIWHVAGEAGADVTKLTRRHQTILIAEAWAIVDHLQVVGQLIRSLSKRDKGPGPVSSQMIDATRTARILRNRMAHLNEGIGNLASRTRRQSPVFGSLSYFVFDPAKPDEGHAVVVRTGMAFGAESMPLINPIGRNFRPPVDLFELSAFGTGFALGPPLALLAAWVRESTENLETQMREGAAAQAGADAARMAELMAHSGGGMALALAMKFDGPVAPAMSVPSADA